ncbi:hypothetical protein MLD38_000857 [Melastoma candidum]|uniref:Uncharacterized protein n=1 Tax=Melastoma candidum TaxID=119954 RepID=A0ACB9SK09_9MYRT|nr:hypothetical protein MLD38_000857 [Melastoma candidum]
MGSHQNRFPQQHRQESRKRWGSCWGALSCFGSQKGGGKRIVPASRIPEGNGPVPQPNGVPPVALVNPATAIHPSLLAPPSSPASFTHSDLPSRVQSPNCQPISASSPGGPSSTMFVTGPYAHETQLVSPPVFSAFTTEPSTAPFTPPAELAHMTTPSSPDVPYAHFLSSTRGIRVAEKNGGYSYYPGSPASSVISPISRMSGDGLSSSFHKPEYPLQWDRAVSPQSDGYITSNTNGATGRPHDTNFFCPATFAKFYLDHNPPFPHTGGRLSVSKDSDAYSTTDNGYQNRLNNRSPKQDPEEMEAYRASFGFSADEITSTPHYVEITDVANESFTMRSPGSSGMHFHDSLGNSFYGEVHNVDKSHAEFVRSSSRRVNSGLVNNGSRNEACSWQNQKDYSAAQPYNGLGYGTPIVHAMTDDERKLFSRTRSLKNGRKYDLGSSKSDAEVEYRRGRSLRENRGGFGSHA